MKKKTYSLYDAKAKLSQIIREVREQGASATITYHGEPVAEIRPIEQPTDPLAARLAEMERRGVIIPGAGPPRFPTLAHRPGALQRFLDERD